ncbi:MAG: hypothetical protein JWN85_335 [Gammaproteobacteria bacterium]|nr:hypothetical protein [Gammaproteobacteria bacterium]
MLGKDGRPSLVVRTHAPIRRIILIAVVTLLALFAFYVVYELGRYNAGYDRLAVAQERTEHEVAMEHLEKTNRELRTQLAELDTIRVGRAREQAEVARGIGDLQAQVARQSQELAFYRGVVAQGASELGLKIGQVRIAAGEKPGQFVVHLSLVRSGRPDNVVTGILVLTVSGESEGKTTTTLDLAALTPGKQRELPFNFRFYENFDQEIAIPAGFKPEHLAVEVRSSRKDVAPVVQTFLWSLESPR